ncbi:hypothetical protein CEQ90_05455 [Lewinellaceae bacterium SD302]|nr:hypothetical protein CEQ90_05455 [Lewinellaceae bacterium SD302]
MKLSQQLFYTLLLCIGFQLKGQTPVSTLECGQADLRMSLRELRINDSLERRYQAELSAENRFFRFGFSEQESSNPPPYVIPIVVHVIHDNGPENISTARVLQGIEWLNQSFANSDYYDQGTGVNTQIQFCLAQRTPDNQPTNGITYTQSPLTNITSIADDIPMKNLARWDPTQYINIYIVREICTSSCGVAGYAYYPSAHGLPMDGIVMEARWLGLNEANNSVLTHEMGHSLGLAHTFDNGCPNDDCLVDGDRVCDTPPDQSTVAVPCGGTANSCSTDTDSGFATDQNDMFNNYMDYGNFGCYNALTQGQTDRMHFFIEGIRASLLTSPGCQTPCPAVVTAGFDQSPLGTSFVVGTTLNFTNTSVNGNGFEWYVNGVLQSSSVDYNLLLDAPGSYQIKLVAGGMPPLCLADSTTIFIQAFCDMDAEYTAANNQPELGQEVLFSAPVTGYNSYEWIVNGTVEGSNEQLLFLFDQIGIYEICLTVEEGNCSQEHCSFYFISNPPITDSCFGPTGVSVYALNAGEIVTAGPLILNGNGGFWQVLRVDNEIVFQEMDGVGNILRIGSANVLDSNFNRFSDFTLLSDGTLLLAYFNGFNIDDRYSYFLRYDPDNDAIVYRKEISYPGTLYNLVPIPGINSSDQFLALFDINSESTSNGSNEAWLFDLDGITGDFETNWNYQTTQGGPHTISHGYFNQAGDFQGIGRIGVTALTSSFRAGIARFSTPNNLSSLRLLHRPATTSARLYGSQLIPLEPRVFSVHNGNPTGTSTTTDYWAYLSLWNNDFLNFTVEYRAAGSQRTIIEGTALEGDTLYHLVRSISQQEDFRFVMATDFFGEILWAYRYELPIGELGATSSSVDCRIYATNNSLIIPFTVRGSGAGGTLNDQAAALLRLNLDGTLDDGCVTITPVEVSFTEVDAVNFPFQMDSGERAKIAFDQENQMTDLSYSQYNGCADSCSTSTSDCGLTGEQFAQVWDFGDGISAQGQSIIADGFGGLVTLGSSETEIFVNRLDISGNPIATYTIDIPTGPGTAEVVAVDVTTEGKLLMGGIIPPRPGMNRTGFFARFDLMSNSLDWWRELDDDAEVMGIHILPDSDDFILTGSRLWQNSSGNSSVLFQRRSLADGQLTGTLYEEYDFGSHADQILSSELIGGTLYTATRYSVSNGNAGMRAGVSWYNVNSGAEMLSMIAGPGPSLDSRTYNNSIAIRQNEIYALYRGDLNGTGTTDVSKVYLAKFTTSGQWVWGREYDLLNFPGEYGMSLEILDNHLIISGNGYGPRDLFALRINQANGDVIWAKGYHDGNGNDLAFNLRGDQSMLVTNTAFFFTAYSQSITGQQRPIVIKTNTAGIAPADNCLETYDLSLEINDLDPWNESGLEPWPEPLLDDNYSPGEGTVDIVNLTFCQEPCDDFEGNCGLTGEQFAQVWKNDDHPVTQGLGIISDATGGIIVMGSSETDLFINRLNTNGESQGTYLIEIPTAPGLARIYTLEVTNNNQLIFGGSMPPRPGMIQTAILGCFDLQSNTLVWWRELDEAANISGIHQIDGTDEFVLAATHNGEFNNIYNTVSIQRREISTGAIVNNVYETYRFGNIGSDNLYSSKLVGNTLYGAGRISLNGNATMRASISAFNADDASELLTLASGPAQGVTSRTYNVCFVIDQNEIYTVYRGNLTGTTFPNTSQVYVAKFTTSGQWIWGRSYDILDFDGEYGLNIRLLDDDMIISGHGLEPFNLFTMRLSQANGELIWGKGYRDTNDGDLRMHVGGDQAMLVTNSRILLTGSLETTDGRQYPQLIALNTDGELTSEGCLEAFDLNFETGEVPVWEETALTPMNSTLEDVTFTPAESSLTFEVLTPCLDTCDQQTNEEICDNGIDDDGNGFTDCEDPALSFDCCCLEGPTVMLPPDTTICPGEQILLYPLGSTAGLVVDWSTGESGDTITISDPGQYSITVTDSCGYLAIDSIMIDTLALPGPIDLGPDLEVCDNGVLSLDAGPGYSSYLWSDFTTEQTATFYDPGIYSVTVTDECGNAYSDTVSLATLPATILDLPEIIALCPQDSQLVTASGFATYAWYPLGATSCDNCPAITVYSPAIGDTVIYTLVVSNDAGCFSTDSVMVTTASLAGTSTSVSICAGEVYDFDGTPLTDAGTYTQPSVCGGTDTLELNVLLPPPVVELADTICAGDSVFVFGEWQFEDAILLDTMMAENGCDSVRRFTLNTKTPPVTMSSERICSGDSILIFGVFRSEPGEYAMTFAQPDDLCDSTVIVTLEVDPKPTVNIQVSDDECGLTTAAVDLTGVTVGTTIDWQEPGLFGTTLELESGLYPFTLTNAAGCTLDSFLVVDIPTSVELEISGFSPLCPDEQDGYLLLSPRGTRSLVSINGAAGLQLDSLGGLAAGRYAVSITDTLGCTSDWDIVIDAPTGFQLLLPEDTIIRLGEELQINGRLFSIEESLVDLQWSPLDYLTCDTCLITSSLPTESITYQLLAIDPLGCSRLDSIRISVDKQSRIYVPSAFSPNGDGVNDVFFLNFGPEIEAVEIMQIYERWGGLVYEREDFPPNDPAYGWDGRIGGKTMDPNVFVWHVRVRLLDGRTLDMSGDLTLIR